jgi:hypothetical protein
MDNSPRLSGIEWQDWADKLLQLHYGPTEYQKIPDTDRGDVGIEGFTISTGHAYQIYGPIEPLSTQERYEKLRTKMTTDLRKFRQNREQLQKIFGTVKITRWVLLVPHYESKKIVQHATKKTQEIIDAKLPYVSADFRVFINDEDAFAVERDKLINAVTQGLSIVGPDINQDQILEWADENDSLVQTIEDKVSKINDLKTDDDRRKFRDEIIRLYLDGQNVSDELRSHPIIYENIWRLKNQKERHLSMMTMMSRGTNMDVMRECLRDIQEAVKCEVRGIAPTTAEAVAFGTVSGWIIQCPLDFIEGR